MWLTDAQKFRCCGSPLFLKSKFGVGYHMTCVKEPNCNVPAVTHMIKQHVPEAKLQSNIGAELTYILPKNMSHVSFLCIHRIQYIYIRSLRHSLICLTFYKRIKSDMA